MNGIQKHIKELIHYYLLWFIPRVWNWHSIWRAINVIQHVNRLKKKSQYYKSIKEKHLKKLKAMCEWKKIISNLVTEEIFYQLNNEYVQKATENITLYNKKYLNTFLTIINKENHMMVKLLHNTILEVLVRTIMQKRKHKDYRI